MPIFLQGGALLETLGTQLNKIHNKGQVVQLSLDVLKE